ncbi:hypothetical protein GPX89_09265 [Nocardia sp. ET3-3]|uniref:Uncharacterized protein n=1 Tax=Nocardia terrae TaxID=2675851 RepID=A0A7K1USV3_9NOCA|nr:hypothetical protein [Nocardia terrae]MVU77436.1 hypothetical protein [Nocardia terrae]
MSDEQRMCQICGERPAGDGYLSMLCPECRTRIETQNATDPYPLVPLREG